MKNLRLNVLISVFTAAFFGFGLFGGATGAQTKTTAKPTPKTTKATPQKTVAQSAPKVTPKAAPKATPKTSAAKPTPTKSSTKSPAAVVKPKTTATPAKTTPAKTTAPKPTADAQIIISSAFSRVRRAPDTAAEIVQTVKLGTVFPITEQNANWFKVSLAKNGADKFGWVSKTVAQILTDAGRGETYRKIADKYLKQPNDFTTAVQIYEFLDAAAGEVKTPKIAADLEFKKLLALQAALKRIPVDRKAQNPFADFLKNNEKVTVYSEPSGELLVVSSEFWQLHDKYKTLPVAEEIAWKAAQNPLPGECEGYINCYLYLIRSTDGEYLNFYPNGKYSRQALKNITNLLDPIAADTGEKAVYVPAGDISDRADFNRYLTEIRAIISKTSYIEKSRTLTQIKQIGDAHR